MSDSSIKHKKSSASKKPKTPKKMESKSKKPLKKEKSGRMRSQPIQAKLTNDLSGTQVVSASTRERMVKDAAYYLAEKRGFIPGDELADWVEAESYIDTLLKGSASQSL